MIRMNVLLYRHCVELNMNWRKYSFLSFDMHCDRLSREGARPQAISFGRPSSQSGRGCSWTPRAERYAALADQ